MRGVNKNPMTTGPAYFVPGFTLMKTALEEFFPRGVKPVRGGIKNLVKNGVEELFPGNAR